MKKIAICPQCKTKVIVEGKIDEKIPIECKKCGKKGIITFRKPTPEPQIQKNIQQKTPTHEQTKPISPKITPTPNTTKTAAKARLSLFKRKETPKKEIEIKKPKQKTTEPIPIIKSPKPSIMKSSRSKSISLFKNKEITKVIDGKTPAQQIPKASSTTKNPKSKETTKRKRISIFKKKDILKKELNQIQLKKDNQKTTKIIPQIDAQDTSKTETIQGATVSLFKKKDKTKQLLTSTSDKKLIEITPQTSQQIQKEPIGQLELKELDFYPVNEPFAYIKILADTITLDKYYKVIEPQLSQQDIENLRFIEDKLIKSLNILLEEIETDDLDIFLSSEINKIIKSYHLETNDITKSKFRYYIKRNFIGYGKIDALMRDPNIEDISCDGSEVPVFLYHRIYSSLKSNVIFSDEKELSAYVVKLAQKCGKHISIAEPMLDATMPDGSRIQMTLSKAVTTKGSTFTIRKFRSDPITPTDLINYNTLSAEMVAYMWMAVENGINALISGGTASGKTSTLNALALFIPRESKIVSIEETREINLPHPNWIPGVSRSGLGEVVNEKIVGEIGLFDLMKAALRQRPEYILVGEIRGQEAYVLFQAMATGHTTYSTVHADSPKSLIHRLEGKPINIPRMMLQSLDIVVIQASVHVDGKNVRRSRQIVEIIDIDPISKEILTNEVFRWDPVADKHVYSGKSYILERIRSQYDMTMEGLSNEFRRRVRILEWMKNKNIRVFKDVATIISSYTENSDELMKRIDVDEKKLVTIPSSSASEEIDDGKIDEPKKKKGGKKKVIKKFWKR